MLDRAQEQIERSIQGVVCKSGVLRSSGQMLRADVFAFERACEVLVDQAGTEAEVDLTQCTYLSSRLVGALVETVMSLQAKGTRVHVHVSPQVGRLLEMAHLYHLFEYEIRETAELHA